MNNRTCRVPGCDAPVGRSGAGGWCPRHYQRWRRHGDPQAAARRRGPARRTPAQLFWAKVNRDGPVPVECPELGACWVWTAATRGGFGAFNLPATGTHPRRRVEAHRFAYEQHVGPVPPGHELGHLCHAVEVERCDGGPECPHRACVNPAHLVAVSQADKPREGDPQARRPAGRPAPATVERFWAKVDRDGPTPTGRPHLGPCWVWTGATRGGFGAFNLPATEASPRRRIDAHRFAYQRHVGPIPPRHELGHLCHAADVERCDGGPECAHRACVNPAHLVAVSQADLPRGIAARHAAQTTCPQGHPYDHVTRQGRRRCTRCMREQAERYRAARGHPTPAGQDAAVTAWIAEHPTPG